ncbi:Pyruvate dehydrogenase E1 component subunit alpha-3, chloroplastic [Dichanthelium oligosanthes]|uniref:Pyruvate dehydrogenase E1 component subunit alpha-3, chloroplastic n=1 Tax=Dichanthelium oligosanthes TaxID=888268 RepID=A0A1E5WM50_9POAL|nr:Pyruvate dehydrogenase E1 component subunit alpha-3, chloroplastic [Dichanthelium oligosanthes]
MKQLTSASRQGHHGRVLHLFFTSLQPGDRGAVDPHPATVPMALRPCARLGNASSGRLIHALVLTPFPSLASDAVAATALLDMYAKCGLVASARWVFDEMPRSDHLVAWNVLLVGYARHCSGRAYEKSHYAARDPITALKKYIIEENLATESETKSIEKKIDDIVEEAVEFADASPHPPRSQLLENVFADPKGFGIGNVF